MKRRLIQLDFPAAFDKVSHRGLLYKLRSIGVGRQFRFIVSKKFLSDRRHRVHLDGKVSVSVDIVLRAPEDSVLCSLLLILYISEVFHIVRNNIVGYAGILIYRQLFVDHFRVLK